MDARWERRLSEYRDWRDAQEQRVAAVEPCIGDREQSMGTHLVEADNWGGLFEPAPVPEDRVLESAASDSSSPPPEREHHALDRHIEADNWGGEFEELAALSQDPVSALDSASSDSDALRVVAAATKYISTDASSACLTLIASTIVLEEIEPEEKPLQIEECEEPLEVDEKVLPSTSGEVLKALVPALDRVALSQGVLSEPRPPRRPPLGPSRLRQLWRPPPRPARRRRALRRPQRVPPLRPPRRRLRFRRPRRPPQLLRPRRRRALRRPRRAPPLHRPRRAPPLHRPRRRPRHPPRLRRPQRLRERGFDLHIVRVRNACSAIFQRLAPQPPGAPMAAASMLSAMEVTRDIKFPGSTRALVDTTLAPDSVDVIPILVLAVVHRAIRVCGNVLLWTCNFYAQLAPTLTCGGNAAAPALPLPPPRAAASASPIHAQAPQVSSLVLAAPWSKSGARPIHAWTVFDEMWSYNSGTAGTTFSRLFSEWLGCYAWGFLNFMSSRIIQCSWSLHIRYDIASTVFAFLIPVKPAPNQMISQFVRPVLVECNQDLHQLIQRPPFCCKSTAHLFMLLLSSQESVPCSAYIQNFCHELMYLGNYASGLLTVLPLLSQGKGFKFRMLNADKSHDDVLLVFASKQDHKQLQQSIMVFVGSREENLLVKIRKNLKHNAALAVVHLREFDDEGHEKLEALAAAASGASGLGLVAVQKKPPWPPPQSNGLSHWLYALQVCYSNVVLLLVGRVFMTFDPGVSCCQNRRMLSIYPITTIELLASHLAQHLGFCRAIVVFQGMAEHFQPRYFSAILAHAYSVDGAAVRLCSTTNASHVVRMVLEGMSAQNMILLELLLALELSRHACLQLWQQSEAMAAWFNYNLVSVLVFSKPSATVGLFRIGLNWYTSSCIELPPWPPPATLHIYTTSELIETMSVGSKLNVLDHVTVAVSDLIEWRYDELQFSQRKSHDVRYTDLKTLPDCKLTSVSFCASIHVALNIQKGMLDKQVQWDPGGTEMSPSALGQAEAQGRCHGAPSSDQNGGRGWKNKAS